MAVDRAVSILARFNAAQHALVSQFRELTPGSGEHQPSNDEWSAAQIVCHVAMANEWAAGVLTGATAACATGASRIHGAFRSHRRAEAEDLPAPCAGRHRLRRRARTAPRQRPPDVEGDRDVDS